jgi:hypothetical protein
MTLLLAALLLVENFLYVDHCRQRGIVIFICMQLLIQMNFVCVMLIETLFGTKIGDAVDDVYL